MDLIDLRSKFFNWTEVLSSQTATRLGIDNTPNAETQGVIVNTAQHMDRLREFLDSPVHVSSWFRSLKLNAAIGSKPSSQHAKGEAVDFTCPELGNCDEVFEDIRPHMVDLGIDQLIREYPDHQNGGWIHVSFSESPRHMALIIDSNGTRRA